MKLTASLVVGEINQVPEDLRHLVGQRLREARKEAGLTLEEVAETVGVVRQAVVFWETGKSYPTINNLRKITSLYGVTIDWLLAEQTAFSSKPNLHLKVESALRAASQDLPPEDMRTIFDLIGFLRERRRRRSVRREG